MHKPAGSDRGRRIGTMPTGLVGRGRRLGRAHGPDQVVDLGAACAGLIARDGWDNQPDWCRTASGDPGYATLPRGMGSPVPGSLGWVPPQVKIDGIPNPISAPTPSNKTWRVVKIRKDELGTQDTMKVMAEMALESATDPSFIEDARSIVRACQARDYRCVMTGDLEFVRGRVRYTEGPLGESEEDGVVYQWLQSPGYLLYVSGLGLCADMATLIAGLLTAQGIGSGFRSVFLDPQRPKGASHVYAMGISKDGIYAIDPVPDRSRLGDEPPREIWVAPPLDYTVALA